MIFNTSTIYLDTVVNLKLDNIDVNVKGELIEKIFLHFGSSAAFVTGAKIAASFLLKTKLSFPTKVAGSLGTGVGFTGVYQIVNIGSKTLHSKFNSQNLNESININVDKIDIYTELENQIINENINKQNLQSFLPKFKSNLNSNSEEFLIRFKELTQNDLKIIENVNSKSTIISNLEKINSKSINEIFKEDDNLNVKEQIINSPLEFSEIEKLTNINDVLIILNYNLILNIVMVYLLFLLIYILSVKFIIDYNFNLDKIKNYYLGNLLHYIISKSITIWSVNNIIWIYFFLISLFIFSCASTFGIYVCIVVLS